jgi:hypothetical protein
MWVLFHSSSKTRAVKDGERFEETCPQCKDHAVFIEVEIEDNVGLFFVDVMGDKRRAYRCTSCSATFDRKDDAPALPTPVRELPKAVPALGARATKRQEAARKIAREIEDELVAIKARLDP